jgi:hypothetical protein
MDARKIRNIKDVSAEAKLLQDQEEKRAKDLVELRKKSNVHDNAIINPTAEVDQHIRIHPRLAERLKPHQVP